MLKSYSINKVIFLERMLVSHAAQLYFTLVFTGASVRLQWERLCFRTGCLTFILVLKTFLNPF